MFFVEESRAANQLKKLGELECRDDCLPIYVKPCPPPKGAIPTYRVYRLYDTKQARPTLQD